MYKIGVMGDRDSIKGFLALGMQIFPVEDTQTASSTLKKLADEEYAVIYITEQLCKEIEKDVDRYKDEVIPAIIPIPGISGSNGFGINNIRKAALRAIGSDMIFNND